MTDGILNLDKPHGPTSHDIINRVRKLTGVRRVGHAGTLDPMATGVLLVCIGQATRVSEYLMAGQKTYRARVRLGITTDTYDAEGQIVTSVAPSKVNRAASMRQVEQALTHFRGTIEQVPPMYSALKHEGKPLHKLARQGIEVKREPRRIEISRLELTLWEPPECTLEMDCSPGTYVRSLAHDLGQTLGCGAHLTGLVRLASGEFHLEDAVTLEAFAQAAAESRWPELLQPIDAALARFPAIHLDADTARRLCLGQAIEPPPQSPPPGGGEAAHLLPKPFSPSQAPPAPPGHPPRSAGGTEGGLARAYGPDGAFLALAAYDPATETWRPHKVFHPSGH
jgi:tRNA pseudouridine55 synthase